jgi:hypothetical protein
LKKTFEKYKEETDTKIVKPGLLIKTTGTTGKSGTKTHFINLCKSRCIKGPDPHDELNIPMVLSKERVGLDKRKRITTSANERKV